MIGLYVCAALAGLMLAAGGVAGLVNLRRTWRRRPR